MKTGCCWASNCIIAPVKVLSAEKKCCRYAFSFSLGLYLHQHGTSGLASSARAATARTYPIMAQHRDGAPAEACLIAEPGSIGSSRPFFGS